MGKVVGAAGAVAVLGAAISLRQAEIAWDRHPSGHVVHGADLRGEPPWESRQICGFFGTLVGVIEAVRVLLFNVGREGARGSLRAFGCLFQAARPRRV